jgi:hypothetical protein
MAKDSLRKLSLRELAELIQADGRDAAEARRTLKEAAQELWEDIAFRALKAGVPVDDAAQEANDCVGRNWTERFDRALAGILDEIRGLTHKQAVANAQQLLEDWLVAGPGRR